MDIESKRNSHNSAAEIMNHTKIDVNPARVSECVIYFLMENEDKRAISINTFDQANCEEAILQVESSSRRQTIDAENKTKRYSVYQHAMRNGDSLQSQQR